MGPRFPKIPIMKDDWKKGSNNLYIYKTLSVLIDWHIFVQPKLRGDNAEICHAKARTNSLKIPTRTGKKEILYFKSLKSLSGTTLITLIYIWIL